MENTETELFVVGLLQKIQNQDENNIDIDLNSMRNLMLQQLEQDILMGESFLDSHSKGKSSMKRQVIDRLDQLKKAKVYVETSLASEEDFSNFLKRTDIKDPIEDEESISISTNQNNSTVQNLTTDKVTSFFIFKKCVAVATLCIGIALFVKYVKK